MIVPLERMVQDRQGGIGPFTKDQNYDIRNVYSNEFASRKKSPNSKGGVGPFTKEQNLRSIERSNGYENPDDDDRSDNPWKIVDITNDADSNSLDNGENEGGRSFSGSNFIQRVSPFAEIAAEDDVTTKQYLPEIREPVLRSNKKESGRSLKLSEITEPILRPRSTRQNLTRRNISSDDDDRQDHDRQEIQETSSTSTRGFTVQFLPERLAGILAQAEKYARQTLLPLISQYTPSFVGGLRQEEPKYFPPLGDNKESFDVTIRSRDQRAKRLDIEKESVEKSEDKEEDIVVVVVDRTSSFDGIEKKEDNVTVKSNESDEWVPIEEPDAAISRRNSNQSRSFDEKDQEMVVASTKKLNDWVPITETTRQSTDNPVKEEEDLLGSTSSSTDSEDSIMTTERSTTSEETRNDERRFIPLIDFENSSDFFPSTSANEIVESRSTDSPTAYTSHIQKIPRSNLNKNREAKTFPRRTMIFPYAYERRKDPRTRYIPLIPEEDIGRSITSIERDR